MKILLAVDGSAYTKHMLAYLAVHPELVGTAGTYTALTVVPAIPAYAGRYLPLEEVKESYEEQAETVLRSVRLFAAQHAWPLEGRYQVGHAGQAIAEVAQAEGFDLVVMGSHGHGALVGTVMGSVAVQVLARCKTPVLVIR